jgi:hypothetical protein
MRLKPLISILIAAFAAYAGYWYYLAYYAEDRVREMARNLARSGLEFDYQQLDISGFPYRLVLDFQNVEVTYRDGPLRLDWSGPSLQGILQPWQPGHAVLFAQDSLIGISYRTERTSAVTIEPGLLSLSLRSTERDGDRYSLVLEDSRVQALSGSAGEFFAERAEIHFRSRRLPPAGATASGLVEPVLAEISLSVSGLGTGPGSGRDETAMIDQFTIDLLPRGRFFPRLTTYSLAAWRDAGSTMDIGKITAGWGKVRVEGDGSVTLDGDLQPLGAISLRTSDPDGLLEKMTGAGWISSRDRHDAAQAIELFRSLAAPGLPVALSISLQGGAITMGPVVLAEFGPLVKR